jgi:type IV pilus assembly protein PilZ
MGEKTEGNRDRDRTRGAERREWKRVLVDLEVDYGNEDNYLFAYIRDISATGIFVRTNNPEKPGTHLNLRFTPTGGEPLELEGEVIWINAYRPGHTDNLHPGMGIRFLELTRDQRRELASLVKTFAYLDGEEPESANGD